MSPNNPNSKYDACDIVAEWLDNQVADLGWCETRRSYAREIGKFSADYELHNLLISISAWNRGNCLDIDVLDTRTLAITMLCAGPCDQQERLLDRWNSLRERLKAVLQG